MKNILYIGLLLVLACLTGLFVKVNCDLVDFEEQIVIENWEQKKRIEELEKDIRMLKMDSYINTNGFEGGEE